MESLIESKAQEGPIVVSSQIEKSVDQLLKTWKQIGVDNATQSKKLDRFYGTLIDMCNAFENRETKTIGEYQENIKQNRLKIKELCAQLNIYFDINIDLDKTLIEQDNYLMKQLEILENKKKNRLDEYEKLVLQQEILCDQLGINKFEIKSKIPSLDEIKLLSNRITELDFIKNERMTKLQSFLNEITTLVNEFDFDATEIPNMLSFKLSENDVNKVKLQYDRLKMKQKEICDEIQTFKVKINELCLLLDISNDEKNQLFANETFLKPQKYLDLLKTEYQRYSAMKFEYNKRLVHKIRLEIAELNEKLYLSPNDTDEFNNESVISEEILKKHEDKLQDLRLRYEEFRSLYEKIDAWNELWATFVVFDKKASDPNRFRAKGYNSLQEEKQRKEFRIKFAKLEEELSVLTVNYKACYNRDFSVKGQNINEYLNKVKSNYETNRKNEKKISTEVPKNGMQRVNSLKNENVKRMSLARKSLMIPPKTPSRVSNAAFGSSTGTTPKSATRITAEKIAKRSRDSFYKKNQTPQRQSVSETQDRTRFKDISNQTKI